MVLCPKCGYQNSGVRFCIKCGTSLPTLSPEALAQIDILQKRIGQDSLNANLYMRLGELFEKDGMINEALVEYHKALMLEASNAEAHLRIGLIYLNQASANKAIQSLAKALQLNPKSLEAKRGLFKAYEQTENVDSALALAQQIANAEPQNLEIHRSLKNLYQKKNLREETAKELQILLRLAPDDKEILREAGDFYAEVDETEKAIHYYSSLAKQEPTDHSVALALGRLHCVTGNYKQCVQELAEKIQWLDGDEKYLAHMYLAFSHAKLGDISEAVEEILSAESLASVELSPMDKALFAEAYFEIGKSQFHKGNLEAIVRYHTHAARLKPADTDYVTCLANAELKLSERQRTTRKKVVRVALSTTSVAVVALGGWLLVHGRIQVEVTPPEYPVRVYLDNHLNRGFKTIMPGVTLSPSVFFGQHSVAVEMDSYEKWDSTISVGFAKTVELKISLRPVFGSLEVTSDPTGAEVYLGGNLLGTTPLGVISIRVGDYQLRIKSHLYEDYVKVITVSRDDTVRLSASLTRQANEP